MSLIISQLCKNNKVRKVTAICTQEVDTVLCVFVSEKTLKGEKPRGNSNHQL